MKGVRDIKVDGRPTIVTLTVSVVIESRVLLSCLGEQLDFWWNVTIHLLFIVT